MALVDRIRGFAGRAGAALHQFSQGAPTRVEGIGSMVQAQYPLISKEQGLLARSVDALFGRISYNAGPQHTRYSTYPAIGLTPQTIQGILRDADLGVVYRWADLSEQILERDGHLRAVDRGRRVEVSGKPFRVQAANDTPLAQSLARFMRAVIDQVDSFERSIYALLGANAVGYSLSEIVYQTTKLRFSDADGKTVSISCILPKQIDWVHPKHVRFERDTDEPKLDIGNGGFLPFPKYKFIFHQAAGDGFSERRGYMRSVVWLHLFKQHCVRDWAIYGALFGIPNIIGKYPRGVVEPTEAQTIYSTLLQDYGQGKPIIVPDDIDVTLTANPPGSGNAAQQSMIGWANTEISKAVQGETLTTELSSSGVGSFNAAETQAEVKHAIIKDDARGLAGDIRSDLFWSVIDLNSDILVRAFGASEDDLKAACPKCSWRIERETSPSQRADIIDKFADRMEIDEDQVREEFGLDAPSTGAKVLRSTPIAISSGGAVVGSLEASDGVDNLEEKTPQKVAASRRSRKKSTSEKKG